MEKFTNHEIFETFMKVAEMYGWKKHVFFGADGWATLESELRKYKKCAV